MTHHEDSSHVILSISVALCCILSHRKCAKTPLHARACATVVPTRVVQDKLWLWPDLSAEGIKASEQSAPVVVPEMDREEYGGNWYVRDLPYGFDTLIENLIGEKRDI